MTSIAERENRQRQFDPYVSAMWGSLRQARSARRLYISPEKLHFRIDPDQVTGSNRHRDQDVGQQS